MSDIAPDHVLAKLVDFTNRGHLEMGVTITVRGLMITGTLISNKKWFDLQAQFIREALKIEGDDVSLHSLFETWSKVTEEAANEDAKVREAIEDIELPDRYLDAINDAEGQVAYIHLTGARIVHPQGFLPTEGTLWRGRLEDVSGWFIGELRRSTT